jgi:metallo-beta-lactamase family protein
MNWRPPRFDARAVGNMLLTHAHNDHSGYLPRLTRDGFRGTVHSTPATGEIAEVLLLDAAKLQEEDAEYANRKGFSRHRPALPLFTSDDVRRTMRLFRDLDYSTNLAIGRGLQVRFHNAGHILGAAFAEVTARQEDRETTIVFSGDVGRYGAPLHVDPEPLPACDVLVVESTYGDRHHDALPLIDQVRTPFQDTVSRRGIILIPAFAVARTQVLMLALRQLMDAGDLPELPMHIDSPMAAEATHIYERHLTTHELDTDVTPDAWRRMMSKVRLHSSVDESKQLNGLEGPRVIIASSGMLTGGRVLHHLRRLLPDERNLVVLAGYQAPGTRGDLLQRHAPTLRVHGDDIPVRAHTLSLSGLSAHADVDELMRWIQSGPAVPKTVFVTHGEPEASAALKARVERETSARVHVPAIGDEFELNATG